VGRPKGCFSNKMRKYRNGTGGMKRELTRGHGSRGGKVMDGGGRGLGGGRVDGAGWEGRRCESEGGKGWRCGGVLRGHAKLRIVRLRGWWIGGVEGTRYITSGSSSGGLY
jgi:hypothetical protein